MADNSKIEWTDATWNPITGCSVVSPGCTNCYAMKLAGTRLRNHPSRKGLTTMSKAGPVWNGELRFNEEWLTQPLVWNRPRHIFVCAHGDLFHENAPDEWIDRVFAVMALASQHRFQVLTKRVERMRQYLATRLPAELFARWAMSNPSGSLTMSRHEVEARLLPSASREHRALYHATMPQWPLPNVWLGVSVENQATADERIPLLLQTPAARRFISAEPLLGPINLYPPAYHPCPNADAMMLDPATGHYECCSSCDFTGVGDEIGIDWVICGGESGGDARPMHPDWARGLRDQCAAAGVPFFFKQWGEWAPKGWVHADTPFDDRHITFNGRGEIASGRSGLTASNNFTMVRAGKAAAGALLDGVEHREMPA